MTSPLTPPVDLITTAVLTMLRTGGRTVYDGVSAANPAAPGYPFDILYAIPGGDADPLPDLEDTNTTVHLAFQVSSVSNLRNQAQHQARVARDLMLGRDETGAYATALAMPAGWVCARRWSDPLTPSADRAGDPPQAVFTVPARYFIAVTPA